MSQSRSVWENAAAPLPGPPLTFHKWRNDIMRIVPIVGAPTLLVSTVFVGDLALPILQGIGEALAIIYIVPSIIISKKDSDRAYDMVAIEFVFLCMCSGMWMGSVVRLALLRSSPNCSSSDDRLFFSIFGEYSKLPCIFSIIAIIGGSIVLTGLLLWLVMLFVGMSLTPNKRFRQTWGMPAHRLARGDSEWHVDLCDPTDAQRVAQEYNARPLSSSSEMAEIPLQPHDRELLEARQDIRRLRAAIQSGYGQTTPLEERQPVLREAERELESLQRLNAILYPRGQPEPARNPRTSIDRPRPRRSNTDNNDPPPVYKATAPPGSVPPGWTPTVEATASNTTNVVRDL